MGVLRYNAEENFKEIEWLTTVAFLGALCCAVLGIKLWFKARLDFGNNSNDDVQVQPRIGVYRPYGIEVYNPSYRESDGVPLFSTSEDITSSIKPIDSELINNNIGSNAQVHKPLVQNNINNSQNALLAENKPSQSTSSKPKEVIKVDNNGKKDEQKIKQDIKQQKPKDVKKSDGKKDKHKKEKVSVEEASKEGLTKKEREAIEKKEKARKAKEEKISDKKDKNKKEDVDVQETSNQALTKKEREAIEKKQKAERAKKEKEEKARKAKEDKENALKLKEEKAKKAKEEKERKNNEAKLKKENDKKAKENKTNQNQSLPVASVIIDDKAGPSQSDTINKVATSKNPVAKTRTIPLNDVESDYSDSWNMVAAHRQNLNNNVKTETTSTNLREMANQQRNDSKKTPLFVPNRKNNATKKSTITKQLDDSDASDEYDV